MVWLNGEYVGEHEGGHSPFEFDITKLLKSDGIQNVTVWAQDDPHDLTQPRGKQDWQLNPHSIWYPRTSGIWQAVWLEHTPATFIRRVDWTASLEDFSLTLDLAVDGPVQPGDQPAAVLADLDLAQQWSLCQTSRRGENRGTRSIPCLIRKEVQERETVIGTRGRNHQHLARPRIERQPPGEAQCPLKTAASGLPPSFHVSFVMVPPPGCRGSSRDAPVDIRTKLGLNGGSAPTGMRYARLLLWQVCPFCETPVEPTGPPQLGRTQWLEPSRPRRERRRAE